MCAFQIELASAKAAHAKVWWQMHESWRAVFDSIKDPGFADYFDVISHSLLCGILFYKQGKHLGNFFQLALLF
jgi:hypothetical protein